eukprot:TRINITY_DN184_c0_g1_i1.p3 TRINITY_DN184_c0_g1~~TRINITY_DN184_c0_g1_i1.p3  ORF type:complete len:137 (-),score=32.71 TRINITY_DN184_c0_g1_i1:951-1361(-)
MSSLAFSAALSKSTLNPKSVLASRKGVLKPTSNKSRRLVVSAYKVTLKTPGGDKVIECEEDMTILDAADEFEVELPYSCRSGSCSSCAGKIESGTVDQSEQSFFDEEQLAAGYVLTCVALPTSDLTIVTHKEEELF